MVKKNGSLKLKVAVCKKVQKAAEVKAGTILLLRM